MAEASPSIQTTAQPDVALRHQQLRPHRTLWGDVWRRFRRHRMAMVGMAILLFLVFAVLVGPLIYRVDPIKPNVLASLQSPSSAYPLGTDDIGRDILARLMLGGRISLAVGLAAMLIAISLGTLIGAVSGFVGGLTDQLLMRLTDMFLALPQLPLLLLTIFLFRDALRGLMGPEAGIFLLVVVVIGSLNWMTNARLVRGSFLSLKEKEFVEAAVAIGVPPWAIMFRHILPNTLGPIIVAATLNVGAAIITESVLSFLGLGFPPDTPTWGRLLFDGKDYMEFAPNMVIWPGLMIFLTVLCINYIGDGLRDAFDPRSHL